MSRAPLALPLALAFAAAIAVGASRADDQAPAARLVGRAVLPAATFADGPPSGRAIAGPQNGVTPPFERQPVQGFSAVLANGDGTYSALCDNGYGALENSADFRLRVYTIRPEPKTAAGGAGRIEVVRFIELRDPEAHLPFAITNHFTKDRVLTGADLDVESMQRAPDGSLWIGDEFGPFVLHFDATGKLLAPPISLPDPDAPDRALRSPQSPYAEEATAVRVMNAVAAHARARGAKRAPLFSPWELLLADGDPATAAPSRAAPPDGAGVGPASSELFDVASLQAAGYPVIVWTVNDPGRMAALIELGVDGIITDRPDLLRAVVTERFPELLDADGLIDPARLDAQGHRGGRDLRPENTLPAMEVALDELMTTLELDLGITADGVPVLGHDPRLSPDKHRRADRKPFGEEEAPLIRDLTLEQLQTGYVADGLLAGRDAQRNDPRLSPVAVAFAEIIGLPDPYAVPSLEQVLAFVRFYAFYYERGPGRDHHEAARRAKNAARVRWNVETKINPRQGHAELTVGPEAFARAVVGVIARQRLADRVDVQSFDFRTLLRVHELDPRIRTGCLFGDFPAFADPSIEGSDDGTNLQGEGTAPTPWLAGLRWPYRRTAGASPFRVAKSGGLEGMAISPDGGTLYPMLEKPLGGQDARELLVFELDAATGRFSPTVHRYPLHERATSIGELTLFAAGRGLVIERDDSQGDLEGFKAIYEVELAEGGGPVKKRRIVDLLRIADPDGISRPAAEGDVGAGERFAFPYWTIESVLVLDDRRIAVFNDNNYPFSVGRHVGSGAPDDTEMIVLELPEALRR